MQISERPCGDMLTIYQIANDQWAHAEQLRWTVLYNFLVGNTILLLGWAAVFAINASSSTKTGSLVVFCVGGFCLSLAWFGLGVRASPDSHAIFVPNKICWRSQRRRAFRGRVR